MKSFEFPEVAKPLIIEGPRTVAQNPVWSHQQSLVEFPDGIRRTFHVVHKKPGVTVVPWVTSTNQELSLLDHELLVIPQVRPNARNALGWCFPAGGMDPIDNGSIEHCGQRELYEEAGVRANHIIDLGSQYAAVHFSDVIDTTTLALGLEFGESNPEATEAIGGARSYTIGELYEMTQTLSPEGLPYMYDGISIAGLAKASLYIALDSKNPRS